MKVLATSDMHGKLPDVSEIEPCDLFIIAGDVTPYHNHEKVFQRSWLEHTFATWLSEIPAGHVVGIGGNHDFVLENSPYVAKNLPWTYLQDEALSFFGPEGQVVNLYGIPWVPNLQRWAFHVNDFTLHKKYQAVPLGTDIVISHGPPLYFGDLSSPKFGSVHCGHTSVNNMMEKIQPKAVVCGHIHESHGEYTIPYANTRLINVARLDDSYEVKYPIVDISHVLEKD